MHIHIPSATDATDSKGNRFKVFDIYVNGIYHGSLRYSQLLLLHTQVKAKYDIDDLVEFPAKIFKITEIELQQRRRFLERYLHCLTQHRVIGSSDVFQDYMLACQQASSDQHEMTVELDVFLCNGKSKKVNCSSYDRTSHVLESTCKSIGISDDLTYYFGIALEYSPLTEDNWKMLAVLTDFQCPYISLSAGNRSAEYKFRLAIRRWFFNPSFLSECLSDPVATNMIYIEVLSDVESNRFELSEEVKRNLLALKKKGNRKEYIELVTSKKKFGSQFCENITADGSTASASAGGTSVKVIARDQEKVYPISKMRCWKVGVLRSCQEHFFTFEFEHDRQKFLWVSIQGHGSILLSQCVYLAVDEFVLTSKKLAIRKPSDQLRQARPSESLPQLKLTSVVPPGEDLSMAVPPPDDDDVPITRADSQSSKDSDASIETNDTEQEEKQTTSVGESSVAAVKKVEVAKVVSKPAASKPVASSQNKPKKKSKNKQEEVLINPTFLYDDDL